MKTLYNKHPESMKILEQAGFENIIKMFKMFYRNSDMDNALGYTNAITKWMSLKAMPSRKSELKAKAFIEATNNPQKEKPKIIEPIQKDETIILMVSVHKDKLNKIERILTLLDVEYVEI